ncbi:hypothetical protein JCM18750_30840 [Halostagnicola bangensis]
MGIDDDIAFLVGLDDDFAADRQPLVFVERNLVEPEIFDIHRVPRGRLRVLWAAVVGEAVCEVIQHNRTANIRLVTLGFAH